MKNKNMNKDTRILILTGGVVPIEMQKLFGKIPSGLIPVNGIPAIFKTIDNLLSNGYTNISVGVGFKKNKIIQLLNQKYGDFIDFEFISVNPKLTPGNSIIESIKKIKEKKLLVILASTILEKSLLQKINFKKNILLSSNNFSDSSKWCIVKTKKDKIISVFEKPKKIEQHSDYSAMIGIYFFNDLNFLKKISKNKSTQKKIPISDLLIEYNKSQPISVIKSEYWYDVGHKNDYFASKKKLLQSRFFNFIELDENNGIVTKKSQNKNKLNSEIDWYSSIPPKIKIKTPKIISYSKNQSNIVMEHIQLPTLAEVWLYGNANLKYWYNILGELKKIVNEFNKETHRVKKQDYHQMYIEKTDKRINELLSKNSKFKKIFNDDKIVINGKIYRNWKNIKEEIFYEINKLFNKSDNCLLHGDLCFSNILYDLSNNQYKLIDPRGKWGSSIFGDIKYDVAKLRHSIVGGYDSINNELFSVEYKKSKINFQVFKPSNYYKISREFDTWLSKRWNLTDIKLIEGLLFISMLPLHQDNFKKQLAFYSIGIQRLNDVLVRKNN
jgi:dTDP-glucose pyrophosphorylase